MGHHRRRKSRGRVWSMAVLAEGLIALLLLVAFTLTIASPPEPAAEPDLDADSDNNDGASPPSRSAYEDAIEDVAGNPAFPGKFIQVNDNDDDGDGVVDFADGFNWDMDRWGWGAVPNPNDNLTGGQGPGDFVPIVLELPEGLDPTDSTILLIYNASQPGVYWAAAGELMPGYPPYGAEEWWGVSGHTWDHSCAPSALGSLRLWLAPERAPRHPVWLVDPTTYPIDWRGYPWDFYELPPGQPLPQGAYVAPGLYFASQLGFSPAIRTITLYAEAVQTSTALAAERIEVYVGPPDWDGTPDCLTPMDAVRLTAVGLDLAFTPGWPAFYEAGDDQVEDAAEGFFDSFGVWKRFPVNWLPVNEMDIDGDGVPNFADGYDLDGVAGNADDRNDVQSPREHECGGCLDLTIHDPLWELPSLANEGVVTFTYAASDPAAVAYDPATRRYTPAPGRLRIWIKHSFVTADQPGDRSPRSPRSVADPLQPGHFIPTGVPVKLAALGLSPENPSVALFLEGIAPSPSYRGDSIEVVLDPDGPGPLPAVCRDRLRVTVVRTSPDLDVDSDNDSPVGTPSRSEAEDALEDTPPGKLISVNDDDDDANGLPDHEDFDNPNEDDFVPMILELPEHAGFFISLDYDPARFRVWTKPGNVPRDPRPYWIWDEEWQTYRRGGDVAGPLGRGLEWPEWVLENGHWRPAGPPLTLYVEALAASTEPGDARIAVRTFNYTYYITTSLGSDAVRFTAVGKKVDLDIDSDNTNGFEPPDRSEAEDEIEDTEGDPERPGKIITVNDNDDDEDGIPDFADGFDLDPETPSDDVALGERFVPLVVELPPALDMRQAMLKFTYDASDPAGVQKDAETGERTPAPGRLRLWLVDGAQARNKASVAVEPAGDFVPGGVAFQASRLKTRHPHDPSAWLLFVEGVACSEAPGDARIEVELDPDGPAGPAPASTDAVRVTMVGIEVIGGFTRGSVTYGGAVRGDDARWYYGAASIGPTYTHRILLRPSIEVKGGVLWVSELGAQWRMCSRLTFDQGYFDAVAQAWNTWVNVLNAWIDAVNVMLAQLGLPALARVEPFTGQAIAELVAAEMKVGVQELVNGPYWVTPEIAEGGTYLLGYGTGEQTPTPGPGGLRPWGLLIAALDVDVDADRSGQIAPADEAYEDLRVRYLAPYGAVILANTDFDAGLKDPQANPMRDCDNNEIDQGDDGIAGIVVRKLGLALGQVPDGLSVELTVRKPLDDTVDIEAKDRVPIFLGTEPGAKGIVGPQQGAVVFRKRPAAANEVGIDALCGQGDLALGIEGLEYGVEVVVTLTLRLETRKGTKTLATEEARILVAPFILLSNDRPVKTVLCTESAPHDLRTGIAKQGVPIDVIELGDARAVFYAQDGMEIGYTRAPGAQRPRPVFISLPYRVAQVPMRHPSWFRERLRQFCGTRNYGLHDLGPNAPLEVSEANYGGNIEVTPSHAAGGVERPFGQVVLGSGADDWLVRFLEHQEVQSPLIHLPVAWLRVGHVDEVVSFFRSERKLIVLLASPRAAIGLYAKQHRQAAPHLAQLDRYQQQFIARIEAIRRAIVEGLGGTENVTFVEIPVFFVNIQATTADGDEVWRAVGASTPERRDIADENDALEKTHANPMNMLIVGTNAFVPKPLGGLMRALEQDIEAKLRHCGLKAIFINAQNLHERGGDIHCATNAIRNP